MQEESAQPDTSVMETDELERDGENEDQTGEGNVDPLLMGDSEEEMEDELREREFEEEEEWREIGDDLVPIRLELFLDGSTFKDTFTWDLTETSVTPEQFARTLCMEMDYPQQFEEAVATTIHKQLNSFHNWRRMFKERKIRIPSAESLILIQLNLTVNDKSLQDQFEWDVKNENVSPESFAHSLCSDLGLSKEFEVSIAHSIREQVNRYLQAIADNSIIREQWVRPVVIDAIREEDELPLWTPSITSASVIPPAVFLADRNMRSRRDRRPPRNRPENVGIAGPFSPLPQNVLSPLISSSLPDGSDVGSSQPSNEEMKRKSDARYQHAVSRPRGMHGRFLSKEETEKLPTQPEEKPNTE